MFAGLPPHSANNAQQTIEKCGRANIVRAVDPGMEKEIQKYETFEDYLDSLVIDDDQRYLGDIDTARKLVQLGYRSACQISNTYFLSFTLSWAEGGGD